MIKQNKDVQSFLLGVRSDDESTIAPSRYRIADSKSPIVPSRSGITNGKVTPTNDCEKKRRRKEKKQISPFEDTLGSKVKHNNSSCYKKKKKDKK